jgi:hypothetical protein
VLAISGEQGTGKTTAVKVLVLLLDPGPVLVRKPPRDADSWVTAAAGSWVVGLNNLSDIPSWLSDSLCRASTGHGESGASSTQTATAAEKPITATASTDGPAAHRLLRPSSDPLPLLPRSRDVGLLPAMQRPRRPARSPRRDGAWTASTDMRPRCERIDDGNLVSLVP